VVGLLLHPGCSTGGGPEADGGAHLPIIYGRPVRSVEDHRADVVALLDVLPAEQVPTELAAGRTLAAPLRSRWALPVADNSAMDGYAVRVADTPGRLRVLGDGAAGALPTAVVVPGVAVRVMTGAPVPAGTEAVVPVEDTTAGGAGEEIEVLVGIHPGAAVRRRGEDTAEGDLALPAGTLLGPAQLAAAVAVGWAQLPVVRRPRVVVLGTGDELVAPGIVPGPAQVPDSNSHGLAAAAAGAGAEVVRAAPAPDDPAALVARLDALAEEHAADLVLTSGGVSMGDFDVVKAALRPLGVRFERVAMQPGMPQACGRWRVDGPAFVGLPGNPVSALISFELFVRPLLRAALGQPARQAIVPVVAGAAVRSPAGRRSFVRVRLEARDGALVAHPEGGQGSHLATGLGRSDALLVVPEGMTDIPAGAPSAALLLPGWAP